MKIVFGKGLAAQLAPLVERHVGDRHDVVVVDDPANPAAIADTDVLVSLEFTAEMAAAAPGLRLLQVPGAGLDRVDLSALPATTALANAYGHEAGIAEYVVGAMLTLMRDLGPLDASLHQGVWKSQWSTQQAAPPPWPELRGKHLGILGFGHIGQAVARRAQAFEMSVCALKRHPDNDKSAVPGVDVRGLGHLDALLQAADFLVVTVPLTPETRAMLGARELAFLRPTAILVNVARAEVIDEQALYAALATRQIAAAALDVWYRYPGDSEPTLPGNAPFHELDNVLMTPHVSGWTQGMLEHRCDVIVENLRRLEAGEPLLNQVSTGR